MYIYTNLMVKLPNVYTETFIFSWGLAFSIKIYYIFAVCWWNLFSYYLVSSMGLDTFTCYSRKNTGQTNNINIVSVPPTISQRAQ